MRIASPAILGIIALLASVSCTGPKAISIAEVIQDDVSIVIPEDKPAEAERWKVLIDPGHGGKSHKYAQLGTPGEYSSSEDPDQKDPERAVNLRVSLALEKELRSDPRFKVLLTRRDNSAVSLKERARMSNDEKVDAFLSIHSNAVSHDKPTEVRDSTRGFTPIFSYRAKSDLSVRRSPIMAAYIGAALNEAGFPSNGIGGSPEQVRNCKKMDFISYWQEYGISSIWTGHKGLAVLTQNARPAVLLETHYMSSPADVESFQNEKAISDFVAALKRGLVAFLQNPDTLHTTDQGADPLTQGISVAADNSEYCKQSKG